MDAGRLEIARTALGWMTNNPDIAHGAVNKGIKKYISAHENQKGDLYLEIGKAALAIGEGEEKISKLVRSYELTKGAGEGTDEAVQHIQTRDEIIAVVEGILKNMSKQQQCRLAVNNGISNFLRTHEPEGQILLVEIASIARMQQDKETDNIRELFESLKIDQPNDDLINVSNEDPDKVPKELRNILTKAPKALGKMALDYLGSPQSYAESIVESIKKGKDLGNCSAIESLDLSKTDLRTRAEFNKILDACKNLKSLVLPKEASEWWLKDIVNKCPKLESLTLGGGTNVFSDLDLLEGLKELTSLSIINQKELKNIDFLEHLKGLINLNLSGCNLSRLSYKICDTDLFNRLPSLRNLNLSNTGFRSDECVKSLSSLESLDFSECGGLYQLKHIGNCTALRNLNLSNCYDVEDISAIGNCKSLENLNLKGCTSLKDISVIEALLDLKNITKP